MTSEQSSQVVDRRSFIGGAFLGVFGGAIGMNALSDASASETPAESAANKTSESTEQWPYWTSNWSVESFSASSEYDDIQFHVELRNELNTHRTWPGVLRAVNQDNYDFQEMAMPVEVPGGKTQLFETNLDAEKGTYEVSIVGLDEPKDTVDVEGV